MTIEEHKDRVLFEAQDLLTRSGAPDQVYTPSRRAWLERFAREPQPPEKRPRLAPPVPGVDPGALPTLEELGLEGRAEHLPAGGEAAARRRLVRLLAGRVREYERLRDFPALEATSRLSPYLRLGVLSPRLCVHAALGRAREEPALAGGREGGWMS